MAKKAGNADLPGMEDRAIKDLEKAALKYDKIKKARMKLTEEEVEAKGEVRELMHKHNRKHYAYGGVEVTLEPPDGIEKVKVKVKVDDDDAPPEEE